MDSELRNWLGAQTWPDLRPEVEAAAGVAFLHPYGFVVVRIPIDRFDGWGIRVHLWPQSQAALALESNQYIHRHGWTLLSRTLVGSVRHASYTVVPDAHAESEWCEYAVTSDLGVGRSVLVRSRCGLAAIEAASCQSRVESGLTLIQATEYHSTAVVDTGAPWAVTLASTESKRQASSAVLAPPSTPASFVNARTPAGDLDPILADVDAAYRVETGARDQWISTVFLTRDGKVLVVRTYRFPQYWQPVGGQGAVGDRDPLDTAIREVAEEVGLDVDRSELVPLGTAPRDRGDGLVHAYAAPARDGWMPVVLESEIVEHKWLTYRELLDADIFGATRHFASALESGDLGH